MPGIRAEVLSLALGLAPILAWGAVANAVAASPALLSASHDAPVPVPAVTVDELLAGLGWARVDILKMAIEGSEVAAIRGTDHLLAASDDLIILYGCNAHALRFFGETRARLITTLQDFGFSSYLAESGSAGSQRLVPVRPGDVQPACVTNYLAVKRHHPRLSDWPVGAPFSLEETIARVLHHARDPDWYTRAHVAEVVREAPPAIACDVRVGAALGRLVTDADERVRKAAEWFEKAGA